MDCIVVDILSSLGDHSCAHVGRYWRVVSWCDEKDTRW